MSQSTSRTSTLRHALMFLTMAFFLAGAMNTSFAMSSSEGTWIDKQYKVDGAWEIFKRDGQTVIKFKDGFNTKGGPDLKVFLSTKDISQVTGKNATSNGVFLSKLKSTQGNQEYVLPSNININDYASLLIHCESFSVLWGGTNI